MMFMGIGTTNNSEKGDGMRRGVSGGWKGIDQHERDVKGGKKL